MKPFAPLPLGRPRRRAWLAPLLAGGVILAAACSSEQGLTPASSPALEAATTRVTGAASAVAAAASRIAAGAAPAGGTAVAGAVPVGTGAANAGATSSGSARVTVGATGNDPVPAGPIDGSTGGGMVHRAVPGGIPVRIAGVGLVAGHPTLTLQNTTDTAVDLDGWQLEVDGEVVVLPPNARLEPHGSIVLHLADGRSRGSDVYLGRSSADLVRGLQPGERVTVRDGRGQIVSKAIVPNLEAAG